MFYEDATGDVFRPTSVEDLIDLLRDPTTGPTVAQGKLAGQRFSFFIRNPRREADRLEDLADNPPEFSAHDVDRLMYFEAFLISISDEPQEPWDDPLGG